MPLEAVGLRNISPHSTFRQAYEQLMAEGAKLCYHGPFNQHTGLPFTLVIAIDEMALPALDHFRDFQLDVSSERPTAIRQLIAARAEIARMMEAAVRLERDLASWQHSEECAKGSHDECGIANDGEWHCEADLERDECEATDCECGKDRTRHLIAELLGESDEAKAAAARRVDVALATRQALRKLVELKDQKEQAGRTPAYESHQPLAWASARAALAGHYGAQAAPDSPAWSSPACRNAERDVFRQILYLIGSGMDPRDGEGMARIAREALTGAPTEGLVARLGVLETALKFYADPGSYQPANMPPEPFDTVIREVPAGTTARQALRPWVKA